MDSGRWTRQGEDRLYHRFGVVAGSYWPEDGAWRWRTLTAEGRASSEGEARGRVKRGGRPFTFAEVAAAVEAQAAARAARDTEAVIILERIAAALGLDAEAPDLVERVIALATGEITDDGVPGRRARGGERE